MRAVSVAAVVAFLIPTETAALVALALSIVSILLSLDANRHSRRRVAGTKEILSETDAEVERQRMEIMELGTQAPPDDD